MQITKFLERERIGWFPITLKVTPTTKTNADGRFKVNTDGSVKMDKRPLPTYQPEYFNAEKNDNSPITSDFETLDESALQARRDLYNKNPSNWNHIAIDTRSVHHIDIDTHEITPEVVKMRDSLPLYRSSTKSFGSHLFVKPSDGWKSTQQRKDQFMQKKKKYPNGSTGDVELLCGIWSFASSTAVVENADMNYDMAGIGGRFIEKGEESPKNVVLAQMASPSPLKLSDLPELEQIVGLIDLRYCREFDSWSRIVCALHNSGFSESFARKWSMMADNYDDQGFDNYWGRHYTSITEGTLRHYARESNPDAYRILISRQFKTKEFSDYALAQLFLHLDCESSVAVRDTTYRYEGKLWAVDHKQSKMQVAVGDSLRGFYYTRKKLNVTMERSDGEEIAENVFMQNLFKKITSAKGIRDIIAMVKPMIQCDDILFDVDPKHDNHISFFNGVFDLDAKEGVTPLRDHVKEDYYTVCLDWSYDRSPTDIDNVLCVLKQIQPDDVQHNLQMTWLASCLRARNNGFFKINYGATARNGKTTEMGIFRDCFPCYSAEVPNTLFEKGNAKVHKFMYGLLTKPIRGAFMEEMKQNKQDSDLLKRFVDGGEIEQEQMYGTTMKGRLTAKLSVSTNHEMRADVDAGIMRRGVRQEYTSRFIEGAEDNKETRKKGIFPAKDVRAMFQDDTMKIAFFKYLLNFDAKELPTLVKEGQAEFATMIQGSDPIHQLIEDTIEITKSNKDFLTRKQLGELAGEKGWRDLKAALERMGCTYKRDSKNDKDPAGRLLCCKKQAHCLIVVDSGEEGT